MILGGDMHLSFTTDRLRALCNTRGLLRERFGDSSVFVERRLLALSNARILGEITVRPPDRRRLEPVYGPQAASVCVRDAGRLYFRACGLTGRQAIDEVDHIEIFAIGWNG
jgi:hypothetical protein